MRARAARGFGGQERHGGRRPRDPVHAKTPGDRGRPESAFGPPSAVYARSSTHTAAPPNAMRRAAAAADSSSATAGVCVRACVCVCAAAAARRRAFAGHPPRPHAGARSDTPTRPSRPGGGVQTSARKISRRSMSGTLRWGSGRARRLRNRAGRGDGTQPPEGGGGEGGD